MAGSIGSVSKSFKMKEGSYVMAAWSNDHIDLYPFKVKEEYRNLPVSEIAERIKKALYAKGWFKYCTESWAGIDNYDPATGLGEIAVKKIYMIGD